MSVTSAGVFKGDKVVWMVFLFLAIISILEVFSSSSTLSFKGGNYWYPIIKHAGMLLLGLLLMLVTLNIPCKYFKAFTAFLYPISLFMLLYVILAGNATNDSHRWIDLFGMQFQPSEIAKGVVVIVCAQMLSLLQTDDGLDKRAIMWIGAVNAPLLILIGLENLSTAALLCITIFMMLIVGRLSMRLVGALMSVGVIVVGLGVGSVMIGGNTESEPPTNEVETVAAADVADDADDEAKPKKHALHRSGTWKSRIEKFFSNKYVSPEEFDIDKDAQVAFSSVAIASSGFLGKGPGKSEQRDLLPQAYSDFIYAIVIEEWGLLGASIVAFLYLVLLFRTGQIAERCENNFPVFLATGLAMMLVVQALFNMAVAVGLAPVTGQPLPLISRGGTSTVINCIYIGVILSVSRTAKRKEVAEPQTA